LCDVTQPCSVMYCMKKKVFFMILFFNCSPLVRTVRILILRSASSLSLASSLREQQVPEPTFNFSSLPMPIVVPTYLKITVYFIFIYIFTFVSTISSYCTQRAALSSLDPLPINSAIRKQLFLLPCYAGIPTVI
jgi:hypothetical protein